MQTFSSNNTSCPRQKRSKKLSFSLRSHLDDGSKLDKAVCIGDASLGSSLEGGQAHLHASSNAPYTSPTADIPSPSLQSTELNNMAPVHCSTINSAAVKRRTTTTDRKGGKVKLPAPLWHQCGRGEDIAQTHNNPCGDSMVRETEEVRSESNSASSGFTSQDLSSADFHDAEYHSYASRCTSLCAQAGSRQSSVTGVSKKVRQQAASESMSAVQSEHTNSSLHQSSSIKLYPSSTATPAAPVNSSRSANEANTSSFNQVINSMSVSVEKANQASVILESQNPSKKFNLSKKQSLPTFNRRRKSSSTRVPYDTLRSPEVHWV
ncbi:hypothetical protein EB796_004752 [Bugula neritina]|uniref:Uncharacterized protein n=1 Tax=Bugula neritina TaxID=10212 RepID=A0A7J7KFF4_BUGNE|nr:hypothetical protein EB796_004752 [Bugula neritina]